MEAVMDAFAEMKGNDWVLIVATFLACCIGSALGAGITNHHSRKLDREQLEREKRAERLSERRRILHGIRSSIASYKEIELCDEVTSTILIYSSGNHPKNMDDVRVRTASIRAKIDRTEVLGLFFADHPSLENKYYCITEAKLCLGAFCMIAERSLSYDSKVVDALKDQIKKAQKATTEAEEILRRDLEELANESE